MLTKKQSTLLRFISEFMKKEGVAPSYEEMGQYMKLKSKSGVYRLVKSLELRGFLRRLPHRARALEVLALPLDKSSYIKKRIPSYREILTDNVVSIPLYGRIACGTPIEAICTTDTVSVPLSIMGRGEHYALTVEGDSMKDVGIMDGDIVIIKRSETADNGAIVVALVDGFEVTLKRIRKQGKQIALIPENEKYETRVFDANRIEIQGLLVGLMRQYH